ncbi:MAG: hypothetical protein KDB83_07245 [Actinobacteria bacterium]|nr:hypothetical protein [Actinomycetota bacterium]MCB0920858.1 hypothetical protein [Actinomycetota bacterium]TXH39446.1 MAG: hypothetical protein E6Q90_16435 [Actinomycetota bacterium]
MADRPGRSGALFDELERWSNLGMGLAALASGYTRSRLVDDEQTQAGDADVVTLADLLAVLPGATASAAAAVQSALFDAVAQVEDLLNRASAAASQVEFTGRPMRALHAWLTDLDRQFRDKQAERAETAAEFLATVGPETTAELLSRVDMNMVLSEVDMDALVDRVTLEKVLEKVDFNSVVADALTQIDATDLTGVLATTTVDSIRTLPGAATRMAGRVVRRPGT